MTVKDLMSKLSQLEPEARVRVGKVKTREGKVRSIAYEPVYDIQGMKYQCDLLIDDGEEQDDVKHEDELQCSRFQDETFEIFCDLVGEITNIEPSLRVIENCCKQLKKLNDLSE